jgi:hypothetical protein
VSLSQSNCLFSTGLVLSPRTSPVMVLGQLFGRGFHIVVSLGTMQRNPETDSRVLCGLGVNFFFEHCEMAQNFVL